MAEERWLKYISNEKLLAVVGGFLEKAKIIYSEAESKLDSNKLDPYSALFESVLQNLDYDEWLKLETGRQAQKSISNALGDLHQSLVGGIDGWEDLGTGRMVDVRNKEKKIVADIKNKHNTVTGQHLPRLYDELGNALRVPEYDGFTAYYVQIIPKRIDLNRCFTPSDNQAGGTHRPENKSIREISGVLFYEIATGEENALYDLYKILPKVLKAEFKVDVGTFSSEDLIKRIYERTYS